MLLNKFKYYFFLSSLVLAGVLLTGAFAPFKLWPLAILSISYLFYTWSYLANSARHAFFYGFLFGLGFFTSAISWVYISLYVFGGLPLWLAVLLCALFIMLLAIFPALTGYLLNRIFTLNHKLIYLIGFSCLWVLMEWLRSHLLSGFPWVIVAFSQTNSPLSGFIPIVGEVGVSWIVCFLSGLLIFLFKWTEKKQLCALLLILTIFGVSSALKQIQWSHTVANPITVSAIQASIPQSLKWDADKFKSNLKTYTQLTEQSLKSDLIIWPESAITLPLQYVDDYLSIWNNRLKKKNKTLLLGLPIQTDLETYYNGLIAIGANHGTYRKRHLVPFGEYPFLYPISQYIIKYFHIPMANFTPGANDQSLMRLGNIKLANYICYEIAYERLVLSDFPAANLIINISDDSWFGDSLAAWQQIQIGQFRAIETSRYAIFSTNDGVTAFINPQGQFIKSLPRYQKAILTAKVTPKIGRTPMMSIGNWWMILSVFFIFIVVWIVGYCRGREN